jgi:hypothetical protein
LVTQLKWRLLEGGGQALYEIGVSDSGQLIGLTRADLEDSLDTLERMAGELGATVIIQKEVTIPSVLLHPREEVDGSVRRTPPLDFDSTDPETSDGIEVDAEDEVVTDSGVDLTTFLRTSPKPIIRDFPYGQSPRMRAFSSTATSKPKSRSPLTKTLTLDDDEDAGSDPTFALDLDISNLSLDVTGPTTPPVPIVTSAVHAKPKVKVKRPQLPRDPEAKAAQRRVKRDLRREERRRALGFDVVEREENKMKEALQVPFVEADVLKLSAIGEGVSPDEAEMSKDPHLIAECLVVRKMALDEAFLDFGGFSLLVE